MIHATSILSKSKAVAEEGLVLLDGPDGIAISMTPDAAEETGTSLIAAAREARGQVAPDG
ncbi:hypothetical protein HZF05_09785 [Sphingomonas sp. CGMCC 1.13654]|uniref:Uncharacterized protein n=1 Tax=Sphingomonas chungangi TaxID=2683589 RepID=A0A838LA62_9SPHN|nr:hypothetical protein [Sphingomonas chungangi]MBA2934388.1 hypothetical protein [Sphingomonas chungangi]MVW57427.1 hypothetical protein [Sphingomonas chungangi]